MLAILYYQENDKNNSREYFQQALNILQRDENQTDYRNKLYTVAISQLGIGEKDKALETYHHAIEGYRGTSLEYAIQNLELLKTSPEPPDGVEEALVILKQAQ